MKKARPFIVIDAETDPFKHGRIPEPFVWGAFDGKYFYKFDKTDDLMKWLSTKKAVIYAHNGGKFDFMFLLDYFEDFTKVKIINGRLSSYKIGEAEFRDSFLILPVPLSNYKKDEIEYWKFEQKHRDKPKYREEILKYLEGDCRYLYELIEGFQNKYGKGLTLAGSAYKVATEMTGLKCEKTTEFFYDMFKPFYHGGRVQAFEKGVKFGKFDYGDLNSAYPEAMKNQMPWGSSFLCGDQLPKGDGPISRAFIEMEAAALGAFPYLTEKGKLEFPAGGEIKTFFVTGWEYLAARDTGTLKNCQIKKVYTFAESVNFSDYIDPFYELKKSAPKESPERLYAKLFLNSYYGKLGANPKKYREYLFAPPSQIDKIESGYYPNFEGFVFADFCGRHALFERPIPEYQQRYYNVATAASITGFVRAKLWRALCKTKRPLYCDTDSIIGQGFQMEFGEEIGQWKLEFTGHKIGLGGKKLYVLRASCAELIKAGLHPKDCKKTRGFHYKKASKGSKLTYSQIFKVADGQEVVYKSEAPTLSLRRGFGFTDRKIRATG